MKRLLLVFLILFTSIVSYAQNPDIYGVWQLTSLEINGEIFYPPSNVTVNGVYTSINSGTNFFETGVCNALFGDAVFSSTASEIQFKNLFQTFDGCTKSENNIFENLYFNFFYNNPDTFTYQITTEASNLKFLEFIDQNNNKAVYRNNLIHDYLFKSWALKYMIVDGEFLYLPSNSEYFQPSLQFKFSDYPIDIEFFGDSGCTDFNGNSFYSYSPREITFESFFAGSNSCQNPENISYEALYRDILNSDTPKTFEYLLTTDFDTEEIFYLRDSENRYAVYHSALLDVPEFDLNQISVTPNPFSSEIQIHSEQEITEALIYNMMGTLILTVHDNFDNLSLSHLTSGIYILEIKSHGKKTFKKIIKR